MKFKDEIISKFPSTSHISDLVDQSKREMGYLTTEVNRMKSLIESKEALFSENRALRERIQVLEAGNSNKDSITITLLQKIAGNTAEMAMHCRDPKISSAEPSFQQRKSLNKDEPAPASQNKATPSPLLSIQSQDTEKQHSNLSSGPSNLISANIPHYDKTSATHVSEAEIAPQQHFPTPVTQPTIPQSAEIAPPQQSPAPVSQSTRPRTTDMAPPQHSIQDCVGAQDNELKDQEQWKIFCDSFLRDTKTDFLGRECNAIKHEVLSYESFSASANDIIEKDYNVDKAIFVLGYNDLKMSRDHQRVFENAKKSLSIARRFYPNAKFVVSEVIIPLNARAFAKEIEHFNQSLREFAKNNAHITFSTHPIINPHNHRHLFHRDGTHLSLDGQTQLSSDLRRAAKGIRPLDYPIRPKQSHADAAPNHGAKSSQQNDFRWSKPNHGPRFGPNGWGNIS